MKIKEFFSNLKEKIDEKRKHTETDSIQDKGEHTTFVTASGVSGFVDLVFFSGLSVALYTIFGVVAVPAGVVLCLMSLIITFGKTWSAMRVAQIDEFTAHLKAQAIECWTELVKPKKFWSRIHKACMVVSVWTAASLSVVSIGDGIRKNQNEIKKANEEIVILADLIDANYAGQASQTNLIISSVSAGSDSVKKANETAAKIWPIIEEYRTERAEFEASGVAFDSKEEIEWKGKEIIPDKYWDKQNSLVIAKTKAAGRTMSINQIRNITSEAVLAQQIKKEIEASNKNASKDELIHLDAQTKERMASTIKNLQGRFHWPNGELVEFDENNPSLALTTLKDLKAAYENDTGDVGESAKIFVLLGPAIENAFSGKRTLENIQRKKGATSFDVSSIMIMVFIMAVGILMEVILAAFTPKPIITRKIFDKYSFSKKLDVEKIMYEINLKYVSDGVFSMEEFYAKINKNVEIDNIPKTLKDYKKTLEKPAKVEKKEKEFSSKVDDSVREIEEMLK